MLRPQYQTSSLLEQVYSRQCWISFLFFLFFLPSFLLNPSERSQSVMIWGVGDLTWFMSRWKTEVFCWAVLSVAVADLDCFRSLQDFHFRQSETSMAWSRDGVWKCDEGGGIRERKRAGHKCRTIMNSDGCAWSHARYFLYPVFSYSLFPISIYLSFSLFYLLGIFKILILVPISRKWQNNKCHHKRLFLF